MPGKIFAEEAADEPPAAKACAGIDGGGRHVLALGSLTRPQLELPDAGLACRNHWPSAARSRFSKAEGPGAAAMMACFSVSAGCASASDPWVASCRSAERR